MISKNLYLQIIFRILLLVATSLVLGWTIFAQKSYILSFLPALFLLFLSFNIIYYLNRINRRIFYFFDAIKNEDSTLSFPENLDNKVVIELNKSLNKVNKQIQQIHIENHQQEQYFQALMEHAATGMFTFDKNGFVIHSNSLTKKLFSLDVFTHLNQLDKVDHKLFISLKNIQASEHRLISINSSAGTVQLLIKASSFIADNNELILISVQDIKNELDEKELDSWRKLIRVMMHEIMNSITPITSLSESLVGYFYSEGQIKTPDQINEKTIETTIRGLEVIREQGKGLISFVDSYRRLTRLPVPEKKVFPVKNLIDNIRILSDSFENAEQIEMICEVIPQELEILADEKQISQVLINLVKNAYQANKGNPNAKVKISSKMNNDGHPEIKVIDNGPGIPEDLMDKIFVPFFTTKESGSGIGLSVSRQIMQMHGGSLKIKTTQGKYTSAVLVF